MKVAGYVGHASNLQDAAAPLGCLAPLGWVTNSINRRALRADNFELTHRNGKLEPWMLAEICRDDKAEGLLERVLATLKQEDGEQPPGQDLPTDKKQGPNLREYQIKCLAELAHARQAHTKYGVAMLATGSGKVCAAACTWYGQPAAARCLTLTTRPLLHMCCRPSWRARTRCAPRPWTPSQ